MSVFGRLVARPRAAMWAMAMFGVWTCLVHGFLYYAAFFKAFEDSFIITMLVTMGWFISAAPFYFFMQQFKLRFGGLQGAFAFISLGLGFVFLMNFYEIGGNAGYTHRLKAENRVWNLDKPGKLKDKSGIGYATITKGTLLSKNTVTGRYAIVSSGSRDSRGRTSSGSTTLYEFDLMPIVDSPEDSTVHVLLKFGRGAKRPLSDSSIVQGYVQRYQPHMQREYGEKYRDDERYWRSEEDALFEAMGDISLTLADNVAVVEVKELFDPTPFGIRTIAIRCGFILAITAFAMLFQWKTVPRS